ncbi:MAG TPA: hypothetical protein V6C85_24510 [Allocoleopsis sp.]
MPPRIPQLEGDLKFRFPLELGDENRDRFLLACLTLRHINLSFIQHLNVRL